MVNPKSPKIGARMVQIPCQSAWASKAFTAMLTLITIAIVSPARAWDTSLPSEDETRRMPAYCHVKMFEDGTPAAGAWYRDYPDGFSHIHHFCYGMGFLNRSFAPMSAHDKTSLLNAAVGQMEYVIGHAGPNFKLLADVFYYRGQALDLLGRTSESVDNLNSSLRIDPESPRAYVLLSRVLEKASQKDTALETATEGLRHAPQSKGLQRRYTELGGKLPYPDPIQSAPQEADRARVPAEIEEGPSSNAAAETPVAAPAAAPTTESVEKLGKDGNPYCRFCPD